MFIISITTNIGMWFERFVIIVLSLHRDFLRSSWGMFHPTWVDICTYLGTFGLFLTLYLLFVKFRPIIAIAEVKGAFSAQRHIDHIYDHYLAAQELEEAGVPWHRVNHKLWSTACTAPSVRSKARTICLRLSPAF